MSDHCVSALKRAAAALLTLCLCLSVGAVAEEATIFSALQPLMDLTASAALHVGEIPETIAPDGVLSEAFVHNFFLLGQQADPALGITPDMLSDTAAQAAYLSGAFAAGQPQLQGIMAFQETYDYIGVRIMAADESYDGTAVKMIGDLYLADKPLDQMTEAEYAAVRWLDQRAVVEMRRDDAAPGGWKLIAFSVEDELQMEDAAQAYFSQTMVEYMNAELGFSLQYPAVFGEETVQEGADGVSARLPDDTASFLARRVANAAGTTLTNLLEQKKQEIPAAEVNINEIGDCGRVTVVAADGSTRVELYIVTPQWIYEAQLCYTSALAKDFALYSDYMMNSFTADELGIG